MGADMACAATVPRREDQIDYHSKSCIEDLLQATEDPQRQRVLLEMFLILDYHELQLNTGNEIAYNEAANEWVTNYQPHFDRAVEIMEIKRAAKNPQSIAKYMRLLYTHASMHDAVCKVYEITGKKITEVPELGKNE